VDLQLGVPLAEKRGEEPPEILGLVAGWDTDRKRRRIGL
jgi:hypothetical protein